MTGLIFTQGRGIQLSAACLGHQPRLEQAGKAVQAGAGWCRYGAGGATTEWGVPPGHQGTQAQAAESHRSSIPPHI